MPTRVVLDTNGIVSGIFFSGPPARIFRAWRDGEIVPVISAEILIEYRRVVQTLASRYPIIDVEPLLSLLVVHSEIISVAPLASQVARDPDEDRFLACALAAGVELIISGDQDLLQLSVWRGIRVLRPREFVEAYLDG